MITDLNNPISLSYSEIARKSFECVSDILDIELYQCRIPATLNPKIKFNPAKKRSETEKAILCTYYDLLDRIYTLQEEFIIMEHDAYLWPNQEEEFRNHFNNISRYDIWNVGKAVECHTMTPSMAKQMTDLISTDFDHDRKGPMAMCCALKDQSCVLFPTFGQKNLISEANNCNNALNSNGPVFSAPVTQCYNSTLGLTNTGRGFTKLTLKNNPDVFFF